MLSAIALIPSATVMVTPLVAAAPRGIGRLHAAVLAAATKLPERWIAVGVGPTDEVIGPDAVGTFGGYGADIGSGPPTRQ